MPGQLRMRRTHYRGLPPLQLPDGYALRTYRDGDETHWARIINAVGSLGTWDESRVRRELTGRPQFDPEGLFFVVSDATPVATACAWRDRLGEAEVGQLHMVAVAPEHQGRRLGTAASVAAVRYFEAHGFAAVYLLTDDVRLAAVRTYLDIGFEPVFPEPDHVERWERVRATLDRGRLADGGS
jgi:mycothiol synthase